MRDVSFQYDLSSYQMQDRDQILINFLATWAYAQAVLHLSMLIWVWQDYSHQRQ